MMEEREEPAEQEYVIVLHFNLDSPWGAFSADHLVPVGATGPEKAVERLIDEVGGSSHSWMSLVEKCNNTETATIAWDGYLSGDKISGENLDHAEAECNDVVFGGITCEGEWVEVENQDEIIAALNKAFAPSEATAKLAEFRAAYERGEKVNTADYLAAVPASQRAYLEQEIDRYLIEESPLRPYDAADFAKFQESELGQKAAELFDQAAQEHLGSDQR